jgi:hypothetical protein
MLIFLINIFMPSQTFNYLENDNEIINEIKIKSLNFFIFSKYEIIFKKFEPII